jgi:MFS family permease
LAGKLREWRAGWPILLGAMLSMGTGISLFGNVNGFFVKPLAAEFGWSRGQISLASMAVLGTALAMPAVGMLVDRRGPRLFILLGAILFAGAYAALSAMPGEIWAYYAIVVFIGVAAGPATAPLVVTRPLVSAFSESRGLALALGMSGAVAVSTFVLPVLQYVIAHYGWRAGYAAMAPLTLALGLAAFFLLRGASPVARAASDPAPEQAGHTFREALSDARFWLLAVSMICISMAGGAFSSQFQPLLSDLGVPGSTAALLGAWYAASVIVGRVGAGFLLDRLWPPAVGAVALSGPILGMPLFLAADPSLVTLLAGAALVGLSTGAEADMLAFFAARYFGLKWFGAIFGVLGLFFGLSVAIGGIAAGFAFDRAGDYRLVLILGAVLAAVSAVSLLASGVAKGRRPGRPSPILSLEPTATA